MYRAVVQKAERVLVTEAREVKRMDDTKEVKRDEEKEILGMPPARYTVPGRVNRKDFGMCLSKHTSQNLLY